MLKLKLKFFLSYPSVDVVKAKEFKNRLLDFPFIDVFMAPDDIPPGVSGANYILKQIQTCDYFIMYVTPNYHVSNYTEQEVGAAWAFKKRMIPFIEPGTEVHGVAQTFQIKEIGIESINFISLISLIFSNQSRFLSAFKSTILSTVLNLPILAKSSDKMAVLSLFTCKKLNTKNKLSRV